MRRYALGFLLGATLLAAQSPDISQTSTLTGTGIGTPIWVGSGGANGAVAWRLTYRVDGANITAATVAIQGANATSASACAALTAPSFTTVPNAGDSAIESSNPSSSAAQGNVGAKTYYPCVVANVTGITGSGGTITVTLAGWKNLFTFSAGSSAASYCNAVTTLTQTYTAITTSGAQRIATGNTGQKIYVCKVLFSTGTPEDLTFTQGTGATCAAGTIATLAAFYNVSAVALDLDGTFTQTATGQDLCVNPSVSQTAGFTIVYFLN